ALQVRAVPALPRGSPCDPSGVQNACRVGDICTIAMGPPPRCAPGTPPELTAVSAQVMENGRSARIIVTGSDVDGDAIAAHMDVLDGAGAVLASAERGLGPGIGQTSFGPLEVYLQDGLVDRLPPVASTRVFLIDGAGLRSGLVAAALLPVPVRPA